MHIDNFKHEDNWQDIKDSTMNTIGKTTGKYPDSEWKKKAYNIRTFTNPAHEILLALEGFEVMGERAYGTA